MAFFRLRRVRRGKRKSAPAAIARKPPKGSRKNPDKGLKLSRAMSALVVKENNKYKETKSATIQFPLAPIQMRVDGTLANDSTAAPVPASIWRLCPAITQGNQESERIGLTCQPVSLRVKGFITFPVDAANTGADAINTALMNIRFYILSSKKIRNYTSLAALDTSTPPLSGYTRMTRNLLTVNGSPGPYSGTLDTDQLLSTNHREVTVHKMRNYQLKRLCLFSNVAGYQRPVKIPFHFSVPVPRTLMFSSNALSTPQQYAPMLVCGSCYESGAAPTSDPTLQPQIIVTSELRFKDA